MHQTDDQSPANGDPSAFSSLSFDPAEFASYVCHFDLNEAEQRELLEAVWIAMVAFVDLGFGIHPVQQILPEDKPNIPVQPESRLMLDSAHSSSTNISTLADRFGACASERIKS